MLSPEQRRLMRTGNELLRFNSKTRARPADFLEGTVALFLHGFTADADNMQVIMQEFANRGYVALAFNYACFDGIDVAARSLHDLIESFNEQTEGHIARHRMVMVGHSMGGLVARAFLALCHGDQFVSKVITLGTPHNGTFVWEKMPIALAMAEFIAKILIPNYSPRSRSALQLTGSDQDLLLEKLKEIPPDNCVEFLSISGGRPELEVGGNPLLNKLVNSIIQGHYRNLPNDGLIAEASSDLSHAMFATCAPGCRHDASYAEYANINHTGLVGNHVIANRVVSFANRPPPQSPPSPPQSPSPFH